MAAIENYFFELSKTTNLKEIAGSAIFKKALVDAKTGEVQIVKTQCIVVIMWIRDNLHTRQRVF